MGWLDDLMAVVPAYSLIDDKLPAVVAMLRTKCTELGKTLIAKRSVASRTLALPPGACTGSLA